ncbi:MAG: NUDIX hydrolase [Promethearchaeota archaeon]
MPNFQTCLEELRLILQSESRLIIDLPDGFQRAAVLIPFIWREKGWSIIFTRRTANVPYHKNEISFPGGRYEADFDEDLIQTALREVDEELGIQKVKVLGLIDDLLTISKFVVTPVVGIIEDTKEVDAEEIPTQEIEYILNPLIYDLTNPEIFSIKEMKYQDNFIFKVPFFNYTENEVIWGATARILVNLLKKLNQLSLDCRLKLMKRYLWEGNGKINNGLDYVDNLKLIKRNS